MDNADLRVARTTLETIVFSQALRPLVRDAGPLGEYGAQTFAQLIVNRLEDQHGNGRA